MIRTAFLLVFLFGIQLPTFSQTYTLPTDAKRIVFLGNSITYQGAYIVLIDAYFSTHYPSKAYEFINVGLPSETVSGLSEPNHADGKFPRPDLHERLKRILAQTKPDLVFASYGMNDGIYMPFNEKRFKKYQKGIDWLHQEVKKPVAELIHITPAIYDERKGEAYANVLDMYSDWLVSKRYTNGWKVIDIHWPMKKKLEENRLSDPTFAFAEDGVHPNEAGHFEMAKHILLALGETALLKINDIKTFLSTHAKGAEVFELVKKRQEISKDAWLSAIGHKRPGMNVGLPMAEAQEKLKEIENQIQMTLKKE